MEGLITGFFHGIRISGPLGVHVEHNKTVKAVAQSDPLHGFEGIVQVVGLGCGRIDADADQRVLSTGAQDVPVFGVKIGGIEL